MDEEVPLKLIELSDFLRSPSILSKGLEFKQRESNEQSADQLVKERCDSDGLRSRAKQPGVVLLKHKEARNGNIRAGEHVTANELIVPKDIIVFADDADRQKIGLFHKSKNYFSRHLLVTSGTALQALIPPLTNAKEWIIVCKLKFSKLYTKRIPIEKNVIISLNINHPFVRYEILTAFDLLQQSFNEIRSAYIMVDFCQILGRWFKDYLKRTEQYPSLSNRILFRYQFQTSKCSITLGKRQYHQDNNYCRLGNNFQKLRYKIDAPVQIYINFNTLPTMVYSIQLNNIFVYSINDECRQLLKDIGNGLSLVSVQAFTHSETEESELNKPPSTAKPETYEGNCAAQDKEEARSCHSSYEPSEQEQILFGKIWENRTKIQHQHQQLMAKAAKLLNSPPSTNAAPSRNHKQSSNVTD